MVPPSLHQAAFESAAMGMTILDPAGRVADANPVMRELMGWPPDRVPGVNGGDLVDPDRLEELREPWLDLVRGARNEISRELRLRRIDGGRVRLRCHMSPVPVPGRRLRNVLVMAHDVASRDEAERRLRMAERIRAVETLAGGIAHDFNNILTVINGHVDLLLAGAGEDQERRADLMQVRVAAERAASLTRHLLAFSQRQLLQPRLVDPSRQMRRLEPRIASLLGEDVDLVLRLEPRPGLVEVDEGQMDQVILALVRNALDAMPRGGRLRLAIRHEDLDASFVRRHPGAAAGPHAVVEVQDSGVGMDDATLARLFEPFFTTKPTGAGAGLGLAMTYGVVKQSGGTISVRSAPGEGAAFSIYLPKAPVEALGGGNGAPAERPETVLLVADEAPSRTVAERMLSGRGYRVIAAADGAEALTSVRGREEELDVVLLDMLLPRLSGPEVASHLRDRRPVLPVIYMSGYLPRVPAEGRREAVLQKPFTGRELAGKVREALDG